MTGGEGHQEGAQAAVDDPHTGQALGAALAGLLQRIDGLDGAEDDHQRRYQEAKHLQTDDHSRTPASLREPVEAVELLRPRLPQVVDGWTDGRQHQRPNGHAGAQGHSGRTQLLGFKGMTDGHPAVHRYTHNGVDAAVYSDKVQALQDRAELLEVGGPPVVGGVHLEGKREEEEQVHQSQAAHVDGRLRPFTQENAEEKQRHGVETHAEDEDGDVDDQLQVLHQVVNIFKGAVA